MSSYAENFIFLNRFLNYVPTSNLLGLKETWKNMGNYRKKPFFLYSFINLFPLFHASIEKKLRIGSSSRSCVPQNSFNKTSTISTASAFILNSFPEISFNCDGDNLSIPGKALLFHSWVDFTKFCETSEKSPGHKKFAVQFYQRLKLQIGAFCTKCCSPFSQFVRKKASPPVLAKKATHVPMLVKLTPGVDFTKLCAPSKNLPANSVLQNICCSISLTFCHTLWQNSPNHYAGFVS